MNTSVPRADFVSPAERKKKICLPGRPPEKRRSHPRESRFPDGFGGLAGRLARGSGILFAPRGRMGLFVGVSLFPAGRYPMSLQQLSRLPVVAVLLALAVVVTAVAWAEEDRKPDKEAKKGEMTLKGTIAKVDPSANRLTIALEDKKA